MLLKKILFWGVWVIFVPFLFVFLSMKAVYLLITTTNTNTIIDPYEKIGWIRQVVYEKMVLEKEEVMEDLRKNPKHPDPKWAKERREIQKFARQYKN